MLQYVTTQGSPFKGNLSPAVVIHEGNCLNVFACGICYNVTMLQCHNVTMLLIAYVTFPPTSARAIVSGIYQVCYNMLHCVIHICYNAQSEPSLWSCLRKWKEPPSPESWDKKFFCVKSQTIWWMSAKAMQMVSASMSGGKNKSNTDCSSTQCCSKPRLMAKCAESAKRCIAEAEAAI